MSKNYLKNYVCLCFAICIYLCSTSNTHAQSYNNESDYYDISVGTDWEYCKKLSSICTKMSDCT